MGKALVLLALLGDIGLKNEGVSVGPVNTLNCVGTIIDCSRVGSTGVVTIGDGGIYGSFTSDGGVYGSFTSDGGYYGNSTFIPDGGTYGSFTGDGGYYGSFDSDGGTYGDGTSASLAASMTRAVTVGGPALPSPRRSRFPMPPCNAVRRTGCGLAKPLGAP